MHINSSRVTDRHWNLDLSSAKLTFICNDLALIRYSNGSDRRLGNECCKSGRDVVVQNPNRSENRAEVSIRKGNDASPSSRVTSERKKTNGKCWTSPPPPLPPPPPTSLWFLSPIRQMEGTGPEVTSTFQRFRRLSHQLFSFFVFLFWVGGGAYSRSASFSCSTSLSFFRWLLLSSLLEPRCFSCWISSVKLGNPGWFQLLVEAGVSFRNSTAWSGAESDCLIDDLLMIEFTFS